MLLLGVTNAETRHDEVDEEAMAAADTSARAAEEGAEDFMVVVDQSICASLWYAEGER